jgi:hypothetical protein
MNSQFNAIDYSQQLQAAGVSQAQAEVHASAVSRVLRDCTASKADLAALDEKLSVRIDALEERIMLGMGAFDERVTLKLADFETKMETFEIKIGARVAACEANVKLELAKIREELTEIRGDLKFNRWMSGVTLAIVFTMFAKLVLP